MGPKLSKEYHDRRLEGIKNKWAGSTLRDLALDGANRGCCPCPTLGWGLGYNPSLILLAVVYLLGTN